jgi:hypothetical protein
MEGQLVNKSGNKEADMPIKKKKKKEKKKKSKGLVLHVQWLQIRGFSKREIK